MSEKEKSKQKKIQLNLGCGSKLIPGYINVDSREDCNPDIVCDIRKLPYGENTVDRILVSDALEHVGRLEVKTVLEQWHNILKPNGILIVKTPNIDTIIDFYKAKKIPFDELVRKMYGNQDYKGNYHYVGFNSKSIEQLLTSVGFKIIKIQPHLSGGDWSNMAIRCIK